MAFTMYTEAGEAATITHTNGGAGTDVKKFKWRDLRVNALNVAAAASTVTIHYDFGSPTAINYILVANFTSTTEVDWSWDYSANNSDWTVNDSDTGFTFDGSHWVNGQASQSKRYWRLVFTRTVASPALTASCIFIGTSYSAPVNYQYQTGIYTRQRTAVETDIYGYPYGQVLNSTNKKIWDIKFNMTGAQLTALLAEMADVNMNCKPFFIKDTIIDTNYHLVHHPSDSIDAVHLGYDYYEVPLHLEEL